MKRFAFLSALATIMPLWAADQPRFEEASVKVAECSIQNSVDPGRIALRGDPLKVVFVQAFKVKVDDITGPAWLDTDCFTIIAKMPDGATGDQLPAMLQTLLAERFKFVAHKESHLCQGYALTVDKNGPKFKESDPPPAVHNIAAGAQKAGEVTFRAGRERAGFKGSLTMASFARLLSNRLGPVQDLTGLKGRYDIDISWAPDPALEKLGQFALSSPERPSSEASVPAGLPDVFTAMRESLGLRLEPHKAAVDTLVIDHIERVPTEN